MRYFMILLLALCSRVVPSLGQDQLDGQTKIDLRILYVGMPDTARQRDFVAFLSNHFKDVQSVDYKTFKEDQANTFQVVILDKDGVQWASRGGDPLSGIRLSPQYNRATMALGVPGSFLFDRMNLKPGYR